MGRVTWVMILCSMVLPVAMGQDVIIVTEQSQLETVGSGNLADYLRGLGYNVTVDAGAGLGVSEYQQDLTAEEIAYLESFDVVVIHRAVSSGNYNTAGAKTAWNGLKVPMLNGSAYLARSSRWFWVNSSEQRTVADTVDLVLPDHPIVAGLTGQFFSVPLGIDHLAPGDVGEGTVIATVTNSAGAAAPVIIAWGPEDGYAANSTYTHTHPRVFLPIYRYHENTTGTDPADGDFPDYTENGLKLIHQAIQWLHSFNGGTSDVAHWQLMN